MAIAPFGEWLPDQVAFGSAGIVGALNVFPAPGGNGYVPCPSPVQSDTDLPGSPRGGILAELPGDIAYRYIGTRTNIYMLAGSGWIDVSRPGGYVLEESDVWEFVQYQQNIIAVGGPNVPIQIASVGGSTFRDLATSSRKPRARRIGLVNGWPVIGHTYDDQDGEQPSRLWWPQLVQIPHPEEWDPDLTTQANYTVALPQAGDGNIIAIVGGPVGVIICQKAVYRMRYINLPEIFEFDRVAAGRGAISAGTVVRVGAQIFFLDQDGFYVTDGQDVSPFGHGKVDLTISARLNKAAAHTIVSTVMPGSGVIIWLLPLDSAETPNYALAYAWKEQRFTISEIGGLSIGEVALPGMSFDDEPWASAIIDQEPWASFAWDSQEFAGGQRAIAVIDDDGKMSYLSGSGLPAVLETQEIAPNHPYVTEVTGVHPIVDGASGTRISVGSRMSVTEPVAFGPERSLNLVGYAAVRERGIFLRGRIFLPEGFKQAIGLDFDSRRAGRR